MEYLLGIDIGTTGCKASIYDRTAKLHGSGYRNYPIISKHPGWAEENPEVWWEKTMEAIKECLQSSKIPSHQIIGAGISCTNGIIPVDKKGHCLSNAIMQLDGRTTKEVEDLEERIGGDKIFEITGNRVAPGTFSAPIIMWLKEKRPEIYERTFKFLSPTGYIVNKMTGVFSMDHTRASTTLLYNIKQKKWSESLCDSLGLDRNKLPEIYFSEEIVGYVTKEAAQQTGLCEGMSVVAGVMDSVAACIGIGTTQAAYPALIVGTVARLCMPMKEAIFDNRFLNAAFTKEVPYLSMSPVNGGGLSVRWFIETFCQDDIRYSEELGYRVYSYLEEQASRIPPGSNSLIYLPYLAGERSPIWDIKARGMFFGISHKHTKYDFYRAVMEGVAYAIRHNLELFSTMPGEEIKAITISGGGAKSKLWSSIFADILAIPIITPDTVESETKGSAFLAGLGTGIYSSFSQAKDLVRQHSIIAPDGVNKSKYKLLYSIYRNLYCHCKEDYMDLYHI